jgi:hypothetical protein
MSTATRSEETEEQAQARKERDWLLALDGLDRASAWLKANKEHLLSFYITLDPSFVHGICVNLQIMDSRGGKAAIVQKLFAGKVATKTTRGNEDTFTIADADLRLSFRWSLWKFHMKEEKPASEEVTI